MGAGGAPIRGTSKAEFEMTLGSLQLHKEVYVADIEDDALLGYDILMGSDGAPSDILLSQDKIVLDGVEVPIFQVRSRGQTRRVVVADDVLLPGQSEVVVDVFVERFEEDDSFQRDLIIEPTENFRETYPLQMASTLVSSNESPTCKVRLLNPFPNEFILRQDAHIGSAETIERVVSTISGAEHAVETGNFAYLRRIQQTDEATETLEGLVMSECEGSVPEHLINLFQKSVAGRSEAERQAIASLLIRHKDTFSKSGCDIGLTNVVEHSINTGDAQPIKQYPRRVPLAHADDKKRAIKDLLQGCHSQKFISLGFSNCFGEEEIERNQTLHKLP